MTDHGDTGNAALRSAVLRGSQHPNLGELSAVSEGRCAVALSRGGAQKRYEYIDPNEDSTAFATAADGVLLVLADAHNGEEASELAVDAIVAQTDSVIALGQLDASSSSERWREQAVELVRLSHAAILDGVTRGARETSRTTLALACVWPASGRFGYASYGDSHIFRVGPVESSDLAYHPESRRFFLGDPALDLGQLGEGTVQGVDSLENVRALVLATDGLSERGIGVDVPEITVSECTQSAEHRAPHLRALHLARGVAEQAMAAQRSRRAGDNIATAVWQPS